MEAITDQNFFFLSLASTRHVTKSPTVVRWPVASAQGKVSVPRTILIDICEAVTPVKGARDLGIFAISVNVQTQISRGRDGTTSNST